MPAIPQGIFKTHHHEQLTMPIQLSDHHLRIKNKFQQSRDYSVTLAKPLTEADMQIQAAAFASPTKWHLAHTTWFYDTFLLKPRGLNVAHTQGFDYLFNSYYEGVSQRQSQHTRGFMSRPSLAEILAYRAAVDEAMLILIDDAKSNENILALIKLGIAHEEQHQELLLTDILFNLSHNPLCPVYQNDYFASLPAFHLQLGLQEQASMQSFAGGLIETGHTGDDFAFDNETPRHQTFVAPFKLATHLVTNREWLEFIEDGGYETPLLWLSDGWRTVQSEAWSAPLYWQKQHDHAINQKNTWYRYSLDGLQALNLDAPVMHIAYFEADAFARWRGQRLPTEAEWEHALGVAQHAPSSLAQLHGICWQWTASPYIAYPGFKTSAGAVGEYNGKFMNGQYVLRGSSFATPQGHSRDTYRNFFYPHQRWQFAGLRLAQDD